MSTRNKIIYWIATLWLSLGMVSTGLVQIFHLQAKTTFLNNLGYPAYFMTILGVWKILGVIALLIPGFPILKEWAYAGFFFLMSGAILSHIATGTTSQAFPSVLLLILITVSWLFRPASRKIALAHQ